MSKPQGPNSLIFILLIFAGLLLYASTMNRILISPTYNDALEVESMSDDKVDCCCDESGDVNCCDEIENREDEDEEDQKLEDVMDQILSPEWD